MNGTDASARPLLAVIGNSEWRPLRAEEGADEFAGTSVAGEAIASGDIVALGESVVFVPDSEEHGSGDGLDSAYSTFAFKVRTNDDVTAYEESDNEAIVSIFVEPVNDPPLMFMSRASFVLSNYGVEDVDTWEDGESVTVQVSVADSGESTTDPLLTLASTSELILKGVLERVMG